MAGQGGRREILVPSSVPDSALTPTPGRALALTLMNPTQVRPHYPAAHRLRHRHRSRHPRRTLSALWEAVAGLPRTIHRQGGPTLHTCGATPHAHRLCTPALGSSTDCLTAFLAPCPCRPAPAAPAAPPPPYRTAQVQAMHMHMHMHMHTYVCTYALSHGTGLANGARAA